MTIVPCKHDDMKVRKRDTIAATDKKKNKLNKLTNAVKNGSHVILSTTII